MRVGSKFQMELIEHDFKTDFLSMQAKKESIQIVIITS